MAMTVFSRKPARTSLITAELVSGTSAGCCACVEKNVAQEMVVIRVSLTRILFILLSVDPPWFLEVNQAYRAAPTVATSLLAGAVGFVWR